MIPDRETPPPLTSREQESLDSVGHSPAARSDLWQSVNVWTRNMWGALTFRSDRAPFGVTLRPGQEPDEVRRHIASAWGWSPDSVVLSAPTP